MKAIDEGMSKVMVDEWMMGFGMVNVIAIPSKASTQDADIYHLHRDV